MPFSFKQFNHNKSRDKIFLINFTTTSTMKLKGGGGLMRFADITNKATTCKFSLPYRIV